jgi:putative mRNA 3-end processing factor
MAKEDFYKLQPNYYVIALSDHADFNGLLEYVRKSEAQLVITDSSRCPKAYTLAREIKNRLGIEALALP